MMAQSLDVQAWQGSQREFLRMIGLVRDEERGRLRGLLAAGAAPVREQTHACILLKADFGDGGPGWVDEAAVVYPSQVCRCALEMCFG